MVTPYFIVDLFTVSYYNIYVNKGNEVNNPS